jgi:hypothetical protein
VGPLERHARSVCAEHYVGLGSGTTGFGFNTDNSDLRGVSAAGLANAWVHVVAIFVNGASNATQLYIDGEPQSM